MKVFITGASSGIGEGLARHYAEAGAVVGLVARRAELLDALAADLEKRGTTVRVYPGDVSDTDFMTGAARNFVETAKGVDLVIANAGIGIPDRVREGDAADIARLLRINVIGVTNTVVPFAPAMIAQGTGVLSAVSSVLGFFAVPGRSPYCASKAAVHAFMNGLRMDLHGTGVHAMTFCPGYVRTPLTAAYKKMLFAVDVDEAVRIMATAVERRVRTVTFPWQMCVLKEFLRRAPEAVVRRVGPPPRDEE